MTELTNITVAQYEIEHLPSWNAYEDKIVRLVEKATEEQDTQLLAFGEYAGLELAGWTNTNLAQQFEFIQTQLDDYHELFSSLAKEYDLFIQPGTLPVKGNNGLYYNRAHLYSPAGNVAYQDKIQLTPFEKQTRLVTPGSELNLFDTPFAKIGIVTCYDSEFPLFASHLCKAGAQLLLVPSCTEKISGLTRVTVSAQARAIENQCYVAQACLIGKATWCDFIDINTGRSAIYCPAEAGFPEDGIISQAQLNTPMLINADLAWEKLQHVRENGEMRNFIDMRIDNSALLNSINVIKMSA